MGHPVWMAKPTKPKRWLWDVQGFDGVRWISSATDGARGVRKSECVRHNPCAVLIKKRSAAVAVEFTPGSTSGARGALAIGPVATHAVIWHIKTAPCRKDKIR